MVKAQPNLSLPVLGEFRTGDARTVPIFADGCRSLPMVADLCRSLPIFCTGCLRPPPPSLSVSPSLSLSLCPRIFVVHLRPRFHHGGHFNADVLRHHGPRLPLLHHLHPVMMLPAAGGGRCALRTMLVLLSSIPGFHRGRW